MHKTYIVVASLEHIETAVEKGFIQANHGKKAPLEKLSRGDTIICYAPKTAISDGEPYQRFSALGTVSDEEISAGAMMSNGHPGYRRSVEYTELEHHAEVRPLLEKLSFIKNIKHWGFPFMRGFFEISEADAAIITAALSSPPGK